MTSVVLAEATPADRLVDAIDVVAAGEALLAPSLTQRLIAEHVRRPPPMTGVPQELNELTQREREVLMLVARGLSNDEIELISTPSADAGPSCEPLSAQLRDSPACSPRQAHGATPIRISSAA